MGGDRRRRRLRDHNSSTGRHGRGCMWRLRGPWVGRVGQRLEGREDFLVGEERVVVVVVVVVMVVVKAEEDDEEEEK